MTVAKFVQPDMTTQDVTSYKANIDAAVVVLKQQGAGFAPRAADTANMTVTVDAGVIFNRATGGFVAQASQVSATITAPGTNSKIVRIYILESGVVGKVEGASAVSPVAPAYPAGCFPVAQVTITSATTTITNTMITDERAFGTGYGVPKNTVLITASNSAWIPPVNSKFVRITAVGGGGGAGGGVSGAADTNKYGGGGGGGAACVIARLFNPESLNIVVGLGGVGGAGGTAAAVNDAVAGTTGGATTITGNTTGLTFTCAAGVLGGRAVTTPTNGAGGAGGAIGTGVAGSAGTVGVTNSKGGDGGDVGTSGSLSAGGLGAFLANIAISRAGVDGEFGSGGGGGFGFGGKGGNGGDGFVLVEIF